MADAWTLRGLKRPATLVRLRVLDPALRASIGGLGDLCAPLAMIAHLGWQPTTVLIVENLQTGLALQDLPGTVAIIGLGYAVELLGNIPWASRTACLYWGDIDTHGLAILHRARSVLPNLVSVMMDDTTLHRFTDLWSNEIGQSAAEVLPALTLAEHALYDGLRSNRWGQGVRLEQERISWDYAWLALCAAVTQATAID
ncbi:Wadjet anti-phage system protein JetD domain-containing protein [Duganella sp. sic0402]|uniref:Wadjet anti-phage system protein JetD domain-containing protein n=1 Tax=Duganella sp. sic0402 TaxID=2854786 RepID=UPI0035A397DA